MTEVSIGYYFLKNSDDSDETIIDLIQMNLIILEIHFV